MLLSLLNQRLNLQKIGNNSIVSITHTVGINMVKYNWNGGEDKIISGKSEKELLVSDLSIPSGDNTLYIEVIDDNGKSTKAYHEYSYDGIAIELSVVNNSKIKIVASDVTGMTSLTYKWNSEEEVTVYPDEEGDVSIDTLTEIPSGLNTLYITAVNTSNITLNKKQEVKGNKKPEISCYIKGNNLYVTATDEEGIKSITINVSGGEEKVYEANGEKEFTCTYDFGGANILVAITATDVDGVYSTVARKNY